MPKLLELIIEGKKWSDIGLTDLYGKINVSTTDPTKSNSGNMYAGLIANILYGDVVDENGLQKVLPQVKELFARQGYMQTSSEFLFEQYLKTGMGQYPLIAGYENQIIEFSIMNKDFWPKVKTRLVILYPIPTVWSEHPVIILDSKAEILINALTDPEVQKLAWQNHGFRTGMAGVQNDMNSIQVPGIPENVTKTIDMPGADVIETILSSLLTNN